MAATGNTQSTPNGPKKPQPTKNTPDPMSAPSCEPAGTPTQHLEWNASPTTTSRQIYDPAEATPMTLRDLWQEGRTTTPLGDTSTSGRSRTKGELWSIFPLHPYPTPTTSTTHFTMGRNLRYHIYSWLRIVSSPMARHHLVYSTGKERYCRNGMRSYRKTSETVVKIVV